jgi:HemY protein
MDNDKSMLGEVFINIGTTEFILTPIQTVIFLGLIALFAILGLKLFSLFLAILSFINGDETAISRYFLKNKERKGFGALSEGLLALASGEGPLALAKANKAEKYLKKPELTNLLVAQAAELSGDLNKATKTYKSLIQNPQTRFVGLRGILKQKLAEGQTEIAIKIAKEAFSIKPTHTETQDILLQLQAELGDWQGARKTLGAKFKKGSIPKDIHRRRDAVLALAEAKDLLNEKASIKQQEAAIEANRLSPDLVPAAVLAARAYIQRGNTRTAIRIINKAWQSQPHPDLKIVFYEIFANESDEEKLKRLQKLCRLNPDHLESKISLSELYLKQENFPMAHRVLKKILTEDQDTRVLTLMAVTERGKGGDDKTIRNLLNLAITAKRGPQWICETCNTTNTDWEPICANCSAMDSLEWKVPTQETTNFTVSDDLLPFLAGEIKMDVPGNKAESEKPTKKQNNKIK